MDILVTLQSLADGLTHGFGERRTHDVLARAGYAAEDANSILHVCPATSSVYSGLERSNVLANAYHHPPLQHDPGTLVRVRRLYNHNEQGGCVRQYCKHLDTPAAPSSEPSSPRPNAIAPTVSCITSSLPSLVHRDHRSRAFRLIKDSGGTTVSGNFCAKS